MYNVKKYIDNFFVVFKQLYVTTMVKVFSIVNGVISQLLYEVERATTQLKHLFTRLPYHDVKEPGIQLLQFTSLFFNSLAL